MVRNYAQYYRIDDHLTGKLVVYANEHMPNTLNLYVHIQLHCKIVSIYTCYRLNKAYHNVIFK